VVTGQGSLRVVKFDGSVWWWSRGSLLARPNRIANTERRGGDWREARIAVAWSSEFSVLGDGAINSSGGPN